MDGQTTYFGITASHGKNPNAISSIFCTTSCTTNPKQIEVMEFVSKRITTSLEQLLRGSDVQVVEPEATKQKFLNYTYLVLTSMTNVLICVVDKCR